MQNSKSTRSLHLPGLKPLNYINSFLRQFYSLSRTTHPDMNPQDPKASERFAQISESYSVLADPEKRKRYDRDHFRAQQASHSATRAAGHTGSYAGSRPPSGLSRRRGAFHGPPPSFYAHGGSAPKNTSSASSSASGGPSPGGTFDANQYSSNPDANFDASSTFKTQSQEDIRRQSRRAAALAAAAAQMEDDSNFWARFFVVTGVILGAITIGTIVSGMGSPKGGMTRGDGSRRDGPSNAWTKG
jgi:curved DNA-binding protein CbpA